MKQKKKLVKNFDPEIIFEDEKDCDEKTLKQIIEVKNHLAKLDRIEANKKRKMTAKGRKGIDSDKQEMYIKVIQKWYNHKSDKSDKSLLSWKTACKYVFGSDKNYNAFLNFLKKISKDKNPIFISEYLEQGKTPKEIVEILIKEKILFRLY